MITAIAIDDEPVALDIIRRHAEKVPFVELKKTFTSATEALTYITGDPVNLVFLDIHMPDISGLEVAGLLDPEVLVIFTTAHLEYAVNGFDMAIADFLLKPINYSRFLQACMHIQKKIEAGEGRRTESLFVKDGYNWVKIRFDELLYIKAEDNYCSLFCTDRRIMTRMTLHELSEKLPLTKFSRVHKSYMVNMAAVEKLENHQLSINGESIPVSQSYRDSLRRLLLK
ncbi:LytTR family DNA-binding domain-containing protein [Mucilaginibacter sp.]|jgi:DNA-binding LytR/AlgR family response regulator|uniref:LytR/AlgR family response regulator transcription factor n=1 Tax=Mucilaginibacter sp. TaxID=1882438 RepID=UPI002B56A8F6|nr:LytTR family DNA-binding domain-containing protein [Mucilaginibacter sp.]HTI57482.1 LytTR family DNA-binding domain-containing protein [Mucilaginibacter sp.]